MSIGLDFLESAKISIFRESQNLLISLTGTIEIPLVKQMATEIKRQIQQGVRHFVLDFSQVSEIVSSTIGYLLVASRHCLEVSATLTICSVKPWILQQLNYTGANHYMRIQEEGLEK